ncbi:nucleolar protein 4 [Trichomonascus vanleenenianus]|uniref:mRNA-binding ribosome biosynthesis protein NOP4 n=1 Tax=Trichomonascus vanleenenianus TaxID=2268995 RepID=UPI003ECA3B4D
MSESVTRKELFVQSLPSDATNQELTDFFSEFAPVRHAVVVTHPGTNECKGFGFVSFADADEAQQALEKAKKTQFKNRRLKIEFAKPRTRGGKDEEKEPKEVKTVEKRRPRLIIRNLPWGVRNPSELEQIFSKYGKVENAYIPRKPGGKMAGFAFVTMMKHAHAIRAVEGSKDLKIAGRPVAVDFAIQKEKWLNKDSQDGEDDEESESEDDEDSMNVDEEDVDEEDVEDASEAEDENEDDDDEDEDEDEDDDEDEEDEDEEEDDEEEDDKPRYRPASNNHTIFVRNIPYDATEETLKEHFKQFGGIRYALPVMDRTLNQPKGTAFVAFYKEEDRDACVAGAPSNAQTGSSVLIADDADPRYVFEGRILSIARAVERDTANKLAESSAKQRAVLLGKEPEKKDKRNVFLLNEGRISSDSKLGANMTAAEKDMRESSYKLRKKQLEGNPSLHLSLTRLAVRNVPRSMNAKAFKQLGRKAVVEFAKDVKEGKRQPLTKEEVLRSKKAAQDFDKPKSKHGVVKQTKVIREQKESGDIGRSRGYGFIEFRDHRTALMGLRWLNAHLVTRDEIVAGLEEEETKNIEKDATGRRLIVEFAIENAQVVKRRRDQEHKTRQSFKRKREVEEQQKKEEEEKKRADKKQKVNSEKEKVRKIIAHKRKAKRAKK